jgi:hypothetical protein
VVAQRKIPAGDQIKTRAKRTKRAAVAEEGAAKIDYHFQKKKYRARKCIGIVSETKKKLSIFIY